MRLPIRGTKVSFVSRQVSILYPCDEEELYKSRVLGADLYSFLQSHIDGVQAGESVLRLLHCSESCLPAQTGECAVLKRYAVAVARRVLHL